MRCNQAVYQSLDARRIVEKQSPVQMMKAIKNEVELSGIINCHVRDAVAKVIFNNPSTHCVD